MERLFPQMLIQLEKDYIFVKPQLPLDAAHAEQVRSAFTYLIEHADRPIRLDLSATKQMDSAGIGALTFLFKRLILIDSYIELVGVNKQTKAFFQKLRIDKIISINQNE